MKKVSILMLMGLIAGTGSLQAQVSPIQPGQRGYTPPPLERAELNRSVENTLADLSRKTDIGFTGGPLTSHLSSLLSELFAQKIDGQRSLLERNGRGVIEALVECIIQVEDRTILMAALPTLDGILFGIFCSANCFIRHLYSLRQ